MSIYFRDPETGYVYDHSREATPDHVEPVLVVGLDDVALLSRLAAAWEDAKYCDLDNEQPMTTRQLRMRAAVRALLDTKPDEPTGLGAVVRDRQDVLWVRARTEKHEWRRPTEADTPLIYRAWAEIDAVEILSEGVTA